MGLRENAKGTVVAHKMDSPAQLFVKSMQLVTATTRTITGMLKVRIWRRRTLTDSSSSAKSLVS